MATRPPRLRVPHTYFHVTSRGGNRWNIFLDDIDRHRFLGLLGRVCERYRIQVHAFCLMGNHFHLLVYCEDPLLSAAMRDLKSRYARYFNSRHRGSGPVFEAPFVEVPVLDDGHLVVEVRYIHRNPLDLNPDQDLASYAWSSHGIYLGLRPQPRWMSTQITRELFGPAYRSIVEVPCDSDKVQNRPGSTFVTPGETKVDEVSWSLAEIRREVALAAEVDLADVRPFSQNGLVGLAILVALDFEGFDPSEVADPYGYRSTAGINSAAKRTRDRLRSDPELAEVYRRVEQRRRGARQDPAA